MLKSDFLTYYSNKKIINNQLLKNIIKHKINYINQLLIINYLYNQLFYYYIKQAHYK